MGGCALERDTKDCPFTDHICCNKDCCPTCGVSRKELAERLRLQELIAYAARELSLGEAPFGDAVGNVLRQVSAFSGTDCSFVRFVDPATLVVTDAYIHHERPTILPAVIGTSVKDLKWLRAQFARGAAVRVHSLAELPAEAGREKARWRRYGFASLLTVPLTEAGATVGFFGIATFTGGSGAARVWMDADTALLEVIGRLILAHWQRRQTAASLQKSEERWLLALQGTNNIIWDWDVKARRLSYSPNLKRLWGYEAYEVDREEGRKSFSRFIHPEDRAGHYKRIYEHFAGLKPVFESVARFRHANGQYYWTLNTGKAVFGPDGRPLRMVGFTTDIQAVKDAETPAAWQASIIDQANAGIMVVDAGGQVVEWFGGAERLFGYGKKEAAGLGIDCFLAWDGGAAADFIRLVLVNGFAETDGTARKKDGTLFPVRFRCTALEETSRLPAGVAIYVIDETERRALAKRNGGQSDSQRRVELLTAILTGKTALNDEARIQAAAVGLDLDSPAVFLAVTVEEYQGQRPEALQGTPGAHLEVLDLIRHVAGGGGRLLSWVNGNHVMAFSQGTGTERDKAIALAVTLRAALLANIRRLDVSVGVSSQCVRPEDLAACDREAREAARYGSGVSGPGIYHFLDIGIGQLLTQLAPTDNARVFVARSLGPLLDYDARKSANLLATLDAILTAQSHREASDRLFVHEKTLVFRKQKIEELLGLSLDKPENRCLLMAAVTLQKINH